MRLARRLLVFAIAALVFEVLALFVNLRGSVWWLLDLIIALAVLYLVVLAVRGWRKQTRLDLPPSMTGRVVRKRHWRLF
ncbi:MAG: hypothetical protein K6T30_04450 [Alicyclobacillus sp.]|nr:hypothetical protein [Alicyclobacillus sp.]